MANTKLPGYPGPSGGGKMRVVVDHDGPGSYTTGGETITPAIFGMKYFDSIIAGLSSDSANYVWPVIAAKGPRTTAKLFWVVLSTGAEVGSTVDLHAKFVRLTITGG